MNTEKYKDYTTDDFVLDEEFVSWVLNPNRETDKLWAEFLEKYPGMRTRIKEAAFIVRAMKPLEEEIPSGRLEELYSAIQSKSFSRKRIFSGRVLKYAAVIILLIGISLFLYMLNPRQDPFPLASLDPAATDRGLVILSDGSSFGFDTKETFIRQTTTGELLINKDTLDIVPGKRKRDAAAMNQVIIPYGKRSEITLSDGTHIWLNSGSQISYPDHFTGNAREVYLSGEAFFDVVTDNDRPFHVITKDIRIRVLGTRFNVTAYSDERTTATVLESGKVSIGRNARIARTFDVAPGQKLIYDRETEVFAKEEADLQYFNSWVHGYLVFRNEPTPDVFRRLERYYNRNIIPGEGLDDITFSGKLDLQDDIDDVLENVAFASSLKIIREDQHYIVKKNAYGNK